MPFPECLTGDRRDLAGKKVIKSHDGFLGEKMGEHEKPLSHPHELLHQLCIQTSCRRTPTVLPFPQLQNFGEVFPGFCWDSVHNPKGGGTCGRVGKAGWDQGKG